MFINSKVLIRGFFRRHLLYRERMVDYLDSWIRIFEGRLRNFESEEGTPCVEVALLFLDALWLALHSCYIWFNSQVARWLRCLQTLCPFGALLPIRVWQNDLGTSFEIYVERKNVNMTTVTHTSNDRWSLFIPGCSVHGSLLIQMTLWVSWWRNPWSPHFMSWCPWKYFC